MRIPVIHIDACKLIDMDEVLERFMGNTGLMDKFFSKFLNDMNYTIICVKYCVNYLQDIITEDNTLTRYVL